MQIVELFFACALEPFCLRFVKLSRFPQATHVTGHLLQIAKCQRVSAGKPRMPGAYIFEALVPGCPLPVFYFIDAVARRENIVARRDLGAQKITPLQVIRGWNSRHGEDGRGQIDK